MDNIVMVLIGLFIYIILVSLIIVFIHSATRKVRPNIKDSKKQEVFNKSSKFYKGEITNGNKER